MLAFKKLDDITRRKNLVESTLLRHLQESEENSDLEEIVTTEEKLDENYSKIVRLLETTLSVTVPLDEDITKKIKEQYELAMKTGKTLVEAIAKLSNGPIATIFKSYQEAKEDEHLEGVVFRHVERVREQGLEAENDMYNQFSYIDAEAVSTLIEFDIRKALYTALCVPFVEGEAFDISVFAGAHLRANTIDTLRNIPSSLVRNYTEFMEFSEDGNVVSTDEEVLTRVIDSFMVAPTSKEEIMEVLTGEKEKVVLEKVMKMVEIIEEVLVSFTTFKEEYLNGSFREKFPEADPNNVLNASALIIFLFERAITMYTMTFQFMINRINARHTTIELIGEEEE